jgi:hypothetical protein
MNISSKCSYFTVCLYQHEVSWSQQFLTIKQFHSLRLRIQYLKSRKQTAKTSKLNTCSDKNSIYFTSNVISVCISRFIHMHIMDVVMGYGSKVWLLSFFIFLTHFIYYSSLCLFYFLTIYLHNRLILPAVQTDSFKQWFEIFLSWYLHILTLKTYIIIM